MANDYYANSAPPESATKMRSRNEADDRAAVEAAFDKLPAEASLKQGVVNTVMTDTGSANAYAVTAPYITAYTAGIALLFKAANSNTGPSTINVSSLGNKSIRRQDRTGLTSGDIVKNGVYLLAYDGTYFQIVSRSTPTAADAEFATESEVEIGTSTTKFMSPYLTKLSQATFYYGDDISTLWGGGITDPRNGDILFSDKVQPPFIYNGTNGHWETVYRASNGVLFDGVANMSLVETLPTSQKGTISFWIKRTSSGTQEYILYIDGTSSAYLNVYLDSDDKIKIRGATTSGFVCLSMDSSTTIADTAWHHVLISWDSSAGSRKLYIDGISRLGTSSSSANTIALSGTLYIARNAANTNKLQAALQDFLFLPSRYLNLSTTSVQRQFRDEAGRPVPWPADDTPGVYLRGPLDQWYVNKGYAGTLFTIPTATDEGTSPSD